MEREWRQDRRKAFGHHGFARAGGPDEQYVVTAGTCHLECTFDRFLPFDVGEIEIIYVAGFVEFGTGVDAGGS